MDPSTAVTFNKLTDKFENFEDWIFGIENQLKECDLWDVCTTEINIEDQNEKKKDEKAKVKIVNVCDQSVYPIIRPAKTAYETINRLKAHAHGGLKERLRLIKELLSNQYNGNMDEYVAKVLARKEGLQGMGAPVDDGFLAMLLLAGLPRGFEHVVAMLDKSNPQITSEMVVKALREEGIRAVPGPSASQQTTAPPPITLEMVAKALRGQGNRAVPGSSASQPTTAPPLEDFTCETCGRECSSTMGLKRHITMSKGACSSQKAREGAAVASPPKRAKPTVQPAPRPPPATASTSAPSLQQTHTIRRLALYNTQWTIKARVADKSNVQSYKKKRRAGIGKYFHMDLRDESGVIRAVAFDDEMHRFYDLIKVNKWYFIHRGQVKQTKKKYKQVDNDYEIVFSSNTQVVECADDDS